MESPLVPGAVGIQVLPVDGVSLDGAEGHTILVGGVAVDKGAPGEALAALLRRIEKGEVRASARGVVADTDVTEEAGATVAGAGGGAAGARGVGEPIGVVVEVFPWAVLDKLQGLEEGADGRGGGVEALEEEGAGLDAADYGVEARDGS
jgi:hypothetical protein